MRTRQALKNTAASLLLQVVLALSGIIVPRFFTEVYGSAVNGLVSSVGQFITYMGLVEAGISAAGTVALYGPLAQNDREKVSGIVSAARAFYLRSGWIFLALVAALVALYPGIVKNEIADAGFVRMMILVLSLNSIVDYFILGKYRVLLQADQRGYVVSVIQIAGTVVMTAVCLLLIHVGASALIVKGAAAAVYLLRSWAVALYVRHQYPDINFRQKPDMAVFDQRWAALVHQVVGMVTGNTDMVLLTLLLKAGALAEVSVYSVYNLVNYSLSSLMTSISNGLGAGFGQVISQGEQDVLRKSYSSFEFLYFVVIFAVYTCMGVLLYPFIGLYSASFTDGVVYVRVSLVVLFTLAGLLQSIRLPGLTVICAAGHFKQTQGRAIAEAAINLGVSIALIGPMGISGVLIGTCLSYLYRTTDVVLYTAKNFVPDTLGISFRRLGRNFLLMGLLLWGLIRFVPQTAGSWFHWFFWAVVSGCVICASFVLINLLLEPKEAKALWERLRGMLNR